MRPAFWRLRAFVLVATFAMGVGAPARLVWGGTLDRHKVIRVATETDEQVQTLLGMTKDVWSLRPDAKFVDVRVSPEELARVIEAGLSFDVLINDVGARARLQLSAVAGADFYDAYQPYDQIISRLTQLIADHPTIASSLDFGTSVEGRTMAGVRITGPGDASGRPGLLIHGGQHAREWVTHATILYVVEWLITNYGTDPIATRLIDDVEWFVLPVMNPDGYVFTWTDYPDNRMWRKNRASNWDGTFGVDLNRNWGYGWGGSGASGDPYSDLYRGPSAFSEPETSAIRDFIWAHENIIGYVDVHSYSELVLWPWGVDYDLTPDDEAFRYLGTRMSDRIEAVHSHRYEYGPIASTLYDVSGGSIDWVYGANINERFIRAYTFELRDQGQYGFLLPPAQIRPTAEETLQPMLFLAGAISAPLRVDLVDAMPDYASPGQTFDVEVQVTPVDDEAVAAGATLAYRQNDQPWMHMEMTELAAGRYRATIPPAHCADNVDWYVVVEDANGAVSGYPMLAPHEWDSVPITAYATRLADNAEQDTGWAMGWFGDTATAGQWERAEPGMGTLEPLSDRTPDGTYCYITDAGRAGEFPMAHDVDGGTTTLTSPVFPLLPSDDAYVHCDLWFWGTTALPEADSLRIEASNDGGSSWLLLGQETGMNQGWRGRSYSLAEAGLASTSTMRLRFVANDAGGESLVEAAVDEITVEAEFCIAPNGDTNQDGHVDAVDCAALASCLSGPDGNAVSAECAGLNTDYDLDVDLADFQHMQLNWSHP